MVSVKPKKRVCGKQFVEPKNEALAFPPAAHDDLIDALAGGFAKAPRRVSLLTGPVEPWEPTSIFDDMIPAGRGLVDW